MRRGAAKVDHDDGLVAAACPGLGLGLGFEEVGQSETAHGEAADAQEITTGHAVAEFAVGFAGKCEHGPLTRRGRAGFQNSALRSLRRAGKKFPPGLGSVESTARQLSFDCPSLPTLIATP